MNGLSPSVLAAGQLIVYLVLLLALAWPLGLFLAHVAGRGKVPGLAWLAPAERLLVTVYIDDDEAAAIWKKVTGFSDDKIIRIAGYTEAINGEEYVAPAADASSASTSESAAESVSASTSESASTSAAA